MEYQKVFFEDNSEEKNYTPDALKASFCTKEKVFIVMFMKKCLYGNCLWLMEANYEEN